MRNANESLHGSSLTNIPKYLNETALDWWQQQRCSFGVCPADISDRSDRLWAFDYTSYYLDVIYNLILATHYYRLGAFAGVGWPVFCSEQVDNVLENLSEWDKAGSNAVITLMALLPFFLAFGNL